MTARRQRRPKQIVLAAHFPGVNNTTVWADPQAGSQIDFSSFVHLAHTAERAKFDFFFLADGQRLREHRGQIYDLDVVGRPDALTVLAAIANVTTHLGLVATANATFNEPYDLARRLATLDLLSGGRAGWNVVTSPDAFTGENFRRGGYLPYGDRYARAAEFVAVARQLWNSWDEDALVCDPDSGEFVRPGAGAFEHHGKHFDVSGHFNVPRSPQVEPVLLQAGDSDAGRDLGAATADAIFTRHGSLESGKAFYADIKRRAANFGRDPDHVKILPGATVVIGDTDAEAEERARTIRYQQVSGASAIAFLERLWNRDLSGYDPDGPLPAIDPDVDGDPVSKGRVAFHGDPIKTARRWRQLAESKGLSIRELVIEVSGRQSFIGSAPAVARKMHEYVEAGAADGFILVPHLTPSGLDEVAAKVVPYLQERGVFRTEYTGTTLREHLGLPAVGAAGAFASKAG